MQPPIGVSGLGVVSAFGTTHAAFVNALLEGRSAVAPIVGFDTEGCRTRIAAQASSFEPTAWMSPMKLRRLDRTGVYAVALTRLAFEDGERAPTPDGDDQSGVVLGTWTAGGQSTQQYLAALFSGGPANAPALLLKAPSGTPRPACRAWSSSCGAERHREPQGSVGSRRDRRRRRACGRRVVNLIAGGVDAVYETFFKAHDRFKVMSDEPAFSPRVAPFNVDRSGFVLGEGGFGLLLHRENGMVSRHGQILGAAAGGAAVRLNAWPDKPGALARTMTLALEDAGLTAADVDVVYASANATRALDATEAAALKTLFAGSRTVITSVKGALGESGASGAASCAAAFLCGRAGRVPPIAGLAAPDPAAAGLNLASTPVEAPGPIVLVNSFASGGALFSVVLRVAS